MKPHTKMDKSLFFKFLNININNNLKLQYTMWDAYRYVTKSKMITSHERFIERIKIKFSNLISESLYIHTNL